MMSQPKPIDRRKTLRWMLFLSLGAAAVSLLNMFTAFLKPVREKNSFGGLVEAGNLEELVARKRTPLHIPRGRFWLVEQKNTLMALHNSCTHLECLFSWDDRKKVFVCPCHGSEFSVNGQVLRGPAERDLDRFPVNLLDKDGKMVEGDSGTGQLVLDNTKNQPPQQGVGDGGEVSSLKILVDTSTRIRGEVS